MSIDIARLSRTELAAMHDAGSEMLDWQRILAKTGDSILGLLQANIGLSDWTHYPPGDVYDPATHAQYFFHRHSREHSDTREHGHIHTFMRPRGMPPGVRPLVLPELAIADALTQPIDSASPPATQPNQGDGNDKFSHIIAISLDASGNPTRLFTTNRWVTGETWYRADDVVSMLARFSIELARPGWPLNRWLCALLGLYGPDISALLRERDDAIMSWRRRRRGKVHVFEDSRLEILTSADIDPIDRVRRVTRALERAA